MSKFRIVLLPRLGRAAAGGWLGGTFFCIGTMLLVFLLPLTVPMHAQPSISISYFVGYKNVAGVLLVAGISVTVFLVSVWEGRGRELVEWTRDARLSVGFVVGVLAVSVAVLSLGSWLVVRSQLRYLADAGYFIEAATVRMETGRALYTQMEFAYGPLLLLPEVWLARALRVSPTVAYYVVYVAESALGLLLVVWVMHQLPMRARLRKWGFVLLALGSVTPHLGLNYTFVRFGVPMAALLWGMKRRAVWQSAVALAVGQTVVLLLSPELAVAMSAAIVVFALCRARQAGAVWLWVGIVPSLTLVTWLKVMGGPYLHMMGQFSRGSLNLPVGPYPHIVAFLIATVWLVPRMFRDAVDVRSVEGTRLLAMYVFGLSLLPAALGRCDPIHVFFDGAVLILLSLVAVSARERAVQTAWICVLAVMVLWMQRVDNKLFLGRTADVLRLSVMTHLTEHTQDDVLGLVRHVVPRLADELNPHLNSEVRVDISAELLERTGGQAIAIPVSVSPALESALRARGGLAPGYFSLWVDVFSLPAEIRAVADMNVNRWALVPANLHGLWGEDLPTLRLLQGMTLPYRLRNPPSYHPGELFESNLRQHWTLRRDFGSYLLYQRRD